MKSMKLRTLYRTTLFTGVCTIVLLSGCGGNSNSASTQANPQPVTTLNSTGNAGTTTSLSITKTSASTTTMPLTKPSPQVSSPSIQAQVSLHLSAETVEPGDALTVEVLVNSMEEVRGGSCDLAFDPALLECTKVEEGGFLRDFAESQGMSTVNMPKAKIDNAMGTITGMGIFIAGRLPAGAKGQGVLCVYRFKVLKGGVPAPEITRITLGGMGENDTSKEIATRIQ